jgi:tripartite-type tricarboxylate transporter receptor subunit TctC
LTKQFGQQIVIENRAGGATMIGTEFVARSAPDGHTLVIATTPHAINPTLYKKVPFDPVKDFTMISQLGLTTTVLVVHPSLPVNNVKEFIALAKARPGQLTAGTAAGNSAYLAVEMIKTMAKIDAVNIPYKGAGQALTDLIAGHIQFQVNTLLAAKPFIDSGRLRAIGVCSAKRSKGLRPAAGMRCSDRPAFRATPRCVSTTALPSRCARRKSPNVWRIRVSRSPRVHPMN